MRTFSDTIPNNLSKAMGPSANVVTIPSKGIYVCFILNCFEEAYMYYN